MSKSWFQKYATYEEEIFEAATGITANATGGQAAGTQLTKKFNRIDTVAVINASVKLPAAKVGKKCFVLNNAGLPALLVCVFPQTGEYIDGVLNGNDIGGINYVSRVPGQKMITYECYDDGKWTTILNPNVITLHSRVKVLEAAIQTSFTTPVILLLQHGSFIIDPISILRSSTNGGYSVNTTGRVTSDFNNVENAHAEFNYDTTFNSWRKCTPNADAFLVNSQGLYFVTRNGNPVGAGGDIIFHITYNLYLP